MYAFVIQQSALLAASFEYFTGKALLPGIQPASLVRELYEAPFALVSHDAQADPVFNYANETAQRLFEMDFEQFTQLPSRLSAEAVKREERQFFLDQVSQRGFISGYSGIRVSKTGKRFRIIDTTIWNLLDEQGNHVGQAAMFPQWEFLS